MGITIHYKGKLNNPDLLNDLTDEMVAISKETEWKYELIDDKVQYVKGIIMRPHIKSETFSLLFNKNLDLVSIAALSLGECNKEGPHVSSIKTQYAPLEIHILVINLLKYLKNKYISDLEVFDDGNYWNTMDKNVLKKNMDFLASRIDMVGDILDAHQGNFKDTDPTEDVADKIEKILKKYGFRKK